jgi:uncharacterized protein (TIGR00730 family)
LAHQGLAKLHVVPTMHERKEKMHGLCDAYIALPGGIGTMEEFFEAVTWRQLGYHNKEIAVLNISGFYDGIESFITKMQRDDFLRLNHRDLFFMETDTARLLDRLGG